MFNLCWSFLPGLGSGTVLWGQYKFFCCSLCICFFPPSGNSLSRSCPKPVFTHHQMDAHSCECFTTQISVSETCSLFASFFEDICKDVWASIGLIYWKCSQTLHGQGSWGWGTSNMVHASCSCESKRQLTASGSTSLCWKNNSSRSALCSFMSASRTTGVKTHLGTHVAYVDTCCSFPLTLRRLCWSPAIPALLLTSFCRVYCDATCCFPSSYLGYKHNHGYRLILTMWKQ